MGGFIDSIRSSVWQERQKLVKSVGRGGGCFSGGGSIGMVPVDFEEREACFAQYAPRKDQVLYKEARLNRGVGGNRSRFFTTG